MKFKLIKAYRIIRGYFPERLPVGLNEFNSWAKSFQDTYKLPTDHEDSIKFVLASAILNLGPQTFYKPKYYFYLTVCAGCSKQISGSVFYEIKQAQKAAEAKAAADESKQQGV